MKVFLLIALLIGLSLPVQAAEMEAPPVTGEAEALMPEGMPGFGEGLLYITKTAIKGLRPDLVQNCRMCLSVIGIAMLVSILNGFTSKNGDLSDMTGVLAVAVLLFGTANSLVHIASNTVRDVSDYGMLLLPVLTAAIAAQGGATSSAILYTGTAFFDTVLVQMISSLLVPLVFLFLALVIGYCAIGEHVLKQLRDFVKWLISWSMKTVLYVFTGYMSISSVITGSTDKAALKAAKLTISGMVPVVGGIMSDASETILLGAGVVKNSVGIYGLLAVVAILIVPFLRVGLLYLLLKGTAAVCGIFTTGKMVDVVRGFSDAMGFLLGMTGAVSMLFLVSIVCFLRGVNV